jgi:Fe2+ transport system protein FeoA
MTRSDIKESAQVRSTASAEPQLTMDQMRRGDEFVVTHGGDERARVTAIRFGISEGSTVRCVTKIPAGPIVLKSGRQEIAVGRNLARKICVRPCDVADCPVADVCPASDSGSGEIG